MNPSESEPPDKTREDLSNETAANPAEKNPYFPEFAKLDSEFESIEYRTDAYFDRFLDLENTYVTKKIWQQKELTVTNWRQLSELEALTLAQFTGDLTVWFDNDVEPELQMHLCRVLAEHRGMLLLLGNLRLTEDAATALLQHSGPIVVAVKLDFHTAYILDTRLVDMQIIGDWWEA